MIDAQRCEDYEEAQKWADALGEAFQSRLRQEADLIYYGHFTWSDVQKLKPIEVRFHMAEINRRIKEIEDSSN